MNIILLSGGSGKRLWPLSNSVRSKQFLQVIEDDNGEYISMIQQAFRKIRKASPESDIVIATSREQVPTLHEQLGKELDVSVEPSRRDTFPAIALACAYMHDVKGVPEKKPVIVCPSDSYVDDGYFVKLAEMEGAVKAGEGLFLMGIEPDSPSGKYGYIIPETGDEISAVKTFKEKPDENTAKKYIEQKGLWNAGVFGFALGYVLDIAVERFGTAAYEELLECYDTLPKISFDYAVVEQAENINVLRYSGMWKDIGTWGSLCQVLPENVSGNAAVVESENTHVVNRTHLPLLALGVSNMAIVATHDGILVTDKDASEHLKDYVESQRPMYEKRCWGEYKVLETEQGILTKHLKLTEGEHISYQRHRNRREIWTVVRGNGTLIIDGEVSAVKAGDIVRIDPGVKHAIKADSELHIIEVQLGDELVEEDIERLNWNWD